MRRDIASAYLAVAARLGGQLVVSAAVYRTLGLVDFAVLNLIRSTVGLLQYTGLGLAPAMVRLLAASSHPQPASPAGVATDSLAISTPLVLAYAAPDATADHAVTPAQRVYASGVALALVLSVVGVVALGAYISVLERVHGLRGPAGEAAMKLALGFGGAIVFRLMSDAPGAALQVVGRMAFDNALVALAELVAAVGAAAAVLSGADVGAVGVAYALSNATLLAARTLAARSLAREISRPGVKMDLVVHKSLLGFGGLVTVAQLADFLYTPVDYILISRLLSVADVGVYAPAVQIDAGLLALVTGLAAVLLPKTAVAHSSGEARTVRRYYVRGTLASVALLAAAAAVVWLLSPWIFRLWLGEDLPATRAILAMVLVHTVVGGSSAVGRSVLLGMGKVKPFTASVLIAGLGNVVLSYVFVRFFGLGLKGVVLGTIVVVVARAGVWMPWYVLRVLRRGAGPSDPGISPVGA